MGLPPAVSFLGGASSGASPAGAFSGGAAERAATKRAAETDNMSNPPQRRNRLADKVTLSPRNAAGEGRVVTRVRPLSAGPTASRTCHPRRRLSPTPYHRGRRSAIRYGPYGRSGSGVTLPSGRPTA